MAIPFQQGRFEELPELPRVAHAWGSAKQREVQLESKALGMHRVHVRVHGEGPPLLLVHGLMTSSYSWRYQLPLLGQHYTCHAPDLPGAGRSDAPLGSRWSPEALAEWLGELQSALGIRGCDVIGNSMGGYVCLHWALRDPGAMGRLINVHSPGIAEPRLYALGAALGLPGSGRLLHWLVHRDPLRWAHKNVHYWDESLKSLEEAREYGGALARAGGTEAFRKYLGETMALGPMKSLKKQLETRREAFPVPLLLLYAERDPMVPARFGDDFARLIPSAALQRLPEASHFMHVDAPERFAAAALAFLKPASAARQAR
jgi:pimeloyl-ACP methyl ester carboxylesterase